MPPIEFAVESARNLIRTTFSGEIKAAHMKEAVLRMEPFSTQLRTGFTVLTDLSGLISMEIECAPHLSKIMDRCRELGVGMVIRVVPDPAKDIGINILSIIHYRGRVRIVTCESLEEAERALSRPRTARP